MLKNLLKTIRFRLDSAMCSWVSRLLTPSFDAIDRKLDALEGVVLVYDLGDLSRKYNALDDTIKYLGDGLGELSTSMGDMVDDLHNMTVTVDDLNSAVSDLDDRLDDLERDVGNIESASFEAIHDFKSNLINALRDMD